MKGYWIALYKKIDSMDNLKNYAAKVTPVIKSYGGKPLVRAISKNYKTSYPPSERFLNKISKLHLGYRSIFTWYMWRSIDPIDV